jgi:hypothetical protein
MWNLIATIGVILTALIVAIYIPERKDKNGKKEKRNNG